MHSTSIFENLTEQILHSNPFEGDRFQIHKHVLKKIPLNIDCKQNFKDFIRSFFLEFPGQATIKKLCKKAKAFSSGGNNPCAYVIYKTIAQFSQMQKNAITIACTNGDICSAVKMTESPKKELHLPCVSDILAACMYGDIKAVACYLALSKQLEQNYHGFSSYFSSHSIKGITLLYLTIEYNQFETADLLLKELKNPIIEDFEGRIPLAILTENYDLNRFDDIQVALAAWKPEGMSLMQAACSWEIKPLINHLINLIALAKQGGKTAEKEKLRQEYISLLSPTIQYNKSCFEILLDKDINFIISIMTLLAPNENPILALEVLMQVPGGIEALQMAPSFLKNCFKKQILEIYLSVKNEIFNDFVRILKIDQKEAYTLLLKKLISNTISKNSIEDYVSFINLFEIFSKTGEVDTSYFPLFYRNYKTNLRNDLHLTLIHLLTKNTEFNINSRDKNGNTLLHLMIQYSNHEAVKLLIKKNARVDIPNDEGITQLRLAIKDTFQSANSLILRLVVKGHGNQSEPLILYYLQNRNRETIKSIQIVFKHELDRFEYSNLFIKIHGVDYKVIDCLQYYTKESFKIKCKELNNERLKCKKSKILKPFTQENEASASAHFNTLIKLSPENRFDLPLITDDQGNNLLHIACQRGFIQLVLEILNRLPKWNLYLRNEKAETAFDLLLQHHPENALEIIKELQQLKFNLNGHNPNGINYLVQLAQAYASDSYGPKEKNCLLIVFETLIDFDVYPDSFYIFSLNQEIDPLFPLFNCLSKHGHQITWKYVWKAIEGDSIPEFILNNLKKLIKNNYLRVCQTNSYFNKVKEKFKTSDSSNLFFIRIFQHHSKYYNGYEEELSWESKKMVIKEKWTSFFKSTQDTFCPYFHLYENSSGNLHLIVADGVFDNVSKRGIKSTIINEKTVNPLYLIKKEMIEFLQSQFVQYYGEQFNKHITARKTPPSFHILPFSIKISDHILHFYNHAFGTNYKWSLVNPNRWLDLASESLLDLKRADEVYKKFFTPSDFPLKYYLIDMETKLTITPIKDQAFEAIFFLEKRVEVIFCTGIWREDTKAFNSALPDGLEEYLEKNLCGITTRFFCTLENIPGKIKKFAPFSSLPAQLRAFETHCQCNVILFDADLKKGKTSFYYFKNEKSLQDMETVLEKSSIYLLPQRLALTYSWQEAINQNSFTLSQKAHKLTGELIPFFEPKDIPSITFEMLLNYFDRFVPLGMRHHRPNIVKFVEVLNGKEITGSHLSKTVSQMLLFSKNIIAKLPLIPQEDRLTIFLEIIRISQWCIPDIHKGLKDLYFRWILKLSPSIYTGKLYQVITQSLDHAKRLAWNELLLSIYDEGQVADTHLLTIMANQLTNHSDFPIVLPADLMIHANSEDPYTVPEAEKLGPREKIRSGFIYLCLQSIVFKFIHIYEDLSTSQHENDRQALLQVSNALCDLILKYALSEKTKEINELESRLQIKTQALVNQINETIDALEKEQREQQMHTQELKILKEIVGTCGKEKYKCLNDESMLIKITQRIHFIEEHHQSKIIQIQEELDLHSKTLSELTTTFEESIKKKKYDLLEKYDWIIYGDDRQFDPSLGKIPNDHIPPLSIHIDAVAAILVNEEILIPIEGKDTFLKAIVNKQKTLLKEIS